MLNNHKQNAQNHQKSEILFHTHEIGKNLNVLRISFIVKMLNNQNYYILPVVTYQYFRKQFGIVQN